ncbi:DUF2809 domain-containing protein [Asticcacaulis benevestitus]|uniref:DUF2809 domain-containing protein n=1 Tax=Asticcacaulis benevestitus DSM 16100 = ATCC BAA-896 TaxID=1121022 RepID=V4QZN4_9CAUL|nr:DUF2809 domain-containing protein [Asticcacaulis benevestitus]ESQ84603.1 hypothetical protein ABENE_19490 [Asticcacaulis benevestitus DSM 16100 = ATCC BAA-896]
MRLRLPYALAALVVFVTEIGIALYVHDAVIRPYIGDSLAVILVYLSLRAVTPMSVLQALAGALVFAFAIEFGQMFHLIDRLGLRGNRVAGFILGGYFDVKDLAAYVAGALAALLVESLRREKSS